MRNRYNYGELVKVNGIGEECGKVKSGLGFIIRKDDFYENYYIDLIFGEKDWFDEKSIERVLEEKRNKRDKYQVRLCTTKHGYDLIRREHKLNAPISNDKLKKIDVYRKFEQNGKVYIIIGWNSNCWPTSNRSIKLIENTINRFKKLKIPFQYVVLNEDVLTDIRIMEFSETDNNVKVFSVERKIKTKKLK